jgi:PilZ domain-containing protein
MPVAQPFETRERFHPRVEANLMVKVLLNGKAILAKAREVSMAGLSLAGDPTLGRNRLTLSLPLPNDREIVTECRVSRREETTVAVEFEQLDWDDLIALARFLHPRLP